ncbi:MAG: NAD(P)-dependent oxidoreductase [Elusimicrobiota bacterium]|nr:NAD(P)-dependent oxidoreductase [Endomicrobiia bacterium]MDW8166252.1 NAD(P)-dependent oxidoreductase [Elusimicrobiota bacterium]
MSLSFEKAIVIGGAGFIGSNLVKRLLEEEVEVLVIDNLFTGRKEFLDSRADFVKIDIRSEKLKDKISKFMPDLVVHMAAIHYIPYCNSHPEETFDVNVMGTRNILEICSMLPRKPKFLFASSAAVYPPLKIPLSEDLAGPIDIYGKTKLIGEDLTKIFFKDALIVRLFNVYGPNDPVPHLIPEILKQIKKGRRELKLGNLTPRRDYIHVDDVCDAIVSLLSNMKSGTFNIGTGCSYSVKEVVDVVSEILNENIKIVQDKKKVRKVEREDLVADISKIQNEIAWRPKISFKTGIKNLLETNLVL